MAEPAHDRPANFLLAVHPELRFLVEKALTNALPGLTLTRASSAAEVMARAGSPDLDMVLIAGDLLDATGMDLLALVRERSTELPVVVMTDPRDEGAAGKALEAVRRGATEAFPLDEESSARLCHLISLRIREARQRQERQRFLAAVAHDLRAPLAGLIGLLDLLQAGNDGPLQPQQAVRLRRIRSTVDRLTAVAAEISDLAMAEAGRLTLKRAAVSLGDTLALAREDVEPLLRSRAVDLHVSLAADLPRVHGDPERLRQILRSILSRSVMRAEGAVVEVNATCAGGVIELTLQESPRSLPVEALPPGFTTAGGEIDANESVLAEGLDLSLARRLVALHGGAIRIGNGGDGRLLAHLQLPAIPSDSRRSVDKPRELHPQA